MHLAVCCVVLVFHQYNVCIHYAGSVYVGGYSGPSKSGLGVLRELCPVIFLIFGEKRQFSCSLYSCRNFDDDGQVV